MHRMQRTRSRAAEAILCGSRTKNASTVRGWCGWLRSASSPGFGVSNYRVLSYPIMQGGQCFVAQAWLRMIDAVCERSFSPLEWILLQILLPEGEHRVVALDQRGCVDKAMLSHGEKYDTVRLACGDQSIDKRFFVLGMDVVVISAIDQQQ